MRESVTIGQALAAELGLPEAQGAPEDQRFGVARLMEWQEVRMKEIEARRKRRVQSAFLPARGRSYGVARRDGD